MTNNFGKEESFGVIPCIFFDTRILVLIVQSQFGHWSFPKGHADDDEKGIDAAKRELNEEVGISSVRIIEENRFLHEYQAKYPDGNVNNKTVTFWVGILNKLEKNKIKPDDDVVAYKWVFLEDVEDLLTYQEAKNMFRKARKFLETIDVSCF